MKTQLLYRETLLNGEELLITTLVAETPLERRERLETYKQEVLQAQRDLLLSATRGGTDLRGLLFNVPGPDAPSDVPCSFTDVALPRPT